MRLYIILAVVEAEYVLLISVKVGPAPFWASRQVRK